jgi:CelD/BcsL family acetyltransferase involved in cellulose biosynthesis
MNWTIHPVSRFAEFADQWDAFVRSRPGTPFLESAFLQPAAAILGTGQEMLCLDQANGKLRAAAIVQRARTGMWETFQPSQLPLGPWISGADADLADELRELIPSLPGLTLGLGASQLDSRLHARPADSRTLRTHDYIQTAWVDVHGDFETYWESRGKNLRQNTRKQRNKLKAEGIETRLECIVSRDAVADAMRDYGQLESAGWKAADGTAVDPDNAQGRFYIRMLENFCAMGRGRIYRYWFGDKVVAMDLCIHDAAAIVILKTSYDETYRVVSPSTLMRQDQFQQLFEERQFQRIEFFGKVMEWHTRWTDNSRSLYHANAYRHAWVVRMLDLRHSMRRTNEPPTSEKEEANV